LHRFRDIARYWSKIAELNLSDYSAPSLGMTPSEFRRDLWHKKIRVPGPSYGVVCVILDLVVLIRRVTDGRTDRQTDRHTSCVKNENMHHHVRNSDVAVRVDDGVARR